MKRVLIISYYWPPAGGGGVMRWLKLSKYLSQDSDWTPVIYCPKNANYLIQDPSLLKQVPKEIELIQEDIVEPNDILLKLGFTQFLKGVAAGGMGKEKQSKSIKSKIMVWVRSNLFIPDARALWIRPSIKRLKKEFKKGAFDAIISTGPPHSTHLIALALKKEFNLPWVADFRDPWTFIDFFEDLDLSKKSREKHFKLESEVLAHADRVVTVSGSWADNFREKTKTQVDLIRNGYDPADYTKLSDIKKEKKFALCHIGSLNKDRNSPVFWESIRELCAENEAFSEALKIQIIGSIGGGFEKYIQEWNLENHVELVHHIPHAEVLKKLASASLSLLFINNTENKGGVVPGKIYEYLAIGNPIFCVGNLEGDSAQIINQAKAGLVCEFEDKEGMKKGLLNYFDLWRNNKLNDLEAEGIESYSRKYQAKLYADLLNKITKLKA